MKMLTKTASAGRAFRYVRTIAITSTVLSTTLLRMAGMVDTGPGLAFAGSFASTAFETVWQRADKPVAEGLAVRSWLWGEQPGKASYEPYAQGTQGERMVQYFDKSRMEVNHPDGNTLDPYYVTNGLLVVEMMGGEIQVGDAQFEPASPADVPVAGDLNDPGQTAPTYAAMANVASLHGENRADKLSPGTPIVATIDSTGHANPTGGPTGLARAAEYTPDTGHNIPNVFWNFLNSQGAVYEGGKQVEAKLMDWVYVMGYPITEPYWTHIRVGGADRLVLVQAFQRRVLTYSPNNPDGWKVEMGNVGMHYYAWRYEQDTTGFVFVNGGYIEPPYSVERQGAGILINGSIVQSASVSSEAHAPDPPPAQPKDASDLVSIASYRLWQLHIGLAKDLTPQIRAGIVSLIKSYPVAADVSDDESGFLVTDSAGSQAVLMVPTEPAPGSEQVNKGLAEMVGDWREVLRSGGALLVSSGVNMEVPAEHTEGFLGALVAAYNLGEADRRAKLNDLIGAPPIVADLMRAGAPPASLRARLPQPRPEATPIPAGLSANKGGSGLFSPPAQGANALSDTPKADKAYIFMTLGGYEEREPVQKAARDQGYQVIFYPSIRYPMGSTTIDNFLATSGQAAILYVAAHGNASALAIEQYATKAQRDAAWKGYHDRGIETLRGEEPSSDGLGTDYTLSIGGNLIEARWRDANTIVQISACDSAGLASNFKAREFIGYPAALYEDQLAKDNSEFWGRLDGTRDNGQKRNVGDAFNGSLLQKTGFVPYSRANGRTVLSPSVVSYSPANGAQLPVGTEARVTITFDTPMDPRWHPLIVSGCGISYLTFANWTDNHTYSYGFIPQAAGQTRLGAVAHFARSLSSQNYFATSRFGDLDGNTKPVGTDHVGANGDNFEWSVGCVGSTIPSTSTPQPTVAPPSTATPQPTVTPPSTATSQPTSTTQATATPEATSTPSATASATATATASPTASPTPSPSPSPTATSTATPIPATATPQPTVTSQPSATSTPVGFFRSIYLDISITNPILQVTYYQVHFADPNLEEQRELYQYSWELIFPPEDPCSNGHIDVSELPWQALWRHPYCQHSPGEQVRVTVTRNDQSVQITGPALGPAQATPTPLPTP